MAVSCRERFTTFQAKLRFAEENSACKALEKAKEEGEGKVLIKDKEIEAAVLEGIEILFCRLMLCTFFNSMACYFFILSMKMKSNEALTNA